MFFEKNPIWTVSLSLLKWIFMMIEEYKETILHELERARNDEEVEQIVNRSIERYKDDDLYRFLFDIFLHILQNGLEKLSDHDFDSGIWCHVPYPSTNKKKWTITEKKYNNE